MTASKLKRNIFYQYLLQVAIYVFPFITLPYLTRVLGPDVYAIRSYALSVMGLVTTAVSYGFNQYGTREVALHKDNLVYIRRLTGVILLLRLGLAFSGFFVVLAMMSFIPLMAANPAYMLITYVGTCLTAMLPDFVFQGLEDMSIMTKRYVASRLVSIVLIFTFVHGPENIVLVAVFETVASFVSFVWSWVDVVRVRGIKPSIEGLSGYNLATCFKAATVFFLSSASTTLFTGLTTVMIGIYVKDAAQVSYWSLATMAVSAVQSLYSPLVNSLYPYVVANRDLRAVKRLLLIGMPVVAVGTVLFWALADVVMLVLGGADYVSGADIVRLVAPVLLFSFPAMMLGFPVLAAIGREKWLTTSSMVSAAFHIVGLVALVAAGTFTIPHVALLRSATEFVLMASRSAFVLRWRRVSYLDEAQQKGTSF